MNGREIYIGDLHGDIVRLRALLDRVGFTDQDQVIALGDVVDHRDEELDGPGLNVACTVDYLIEIGAISLLGNHDAWFLEWLNGGRARAVWLHQGGANTLRSYNIFDPTQPFRPSMIPEQHVRFFKQMLQYRVTDRVVAVHGGVPSVMVSIKMLRGQSLTRLEEFDAIWDQSLALELEIEQLIHDRIVLVGHTQHRVGISNPFVNNRLICCDSFGSLWGCVVESSGSWSLVESPEPRNQHHPGYHAAVIQLPNVYPQERPYAIS